MATKIITAWIDGTVQEIEVEDIISPEQNLSYEDRLNATIEYVNEYVEEVSTNIATALQKSQVQIITWEDDD